MKQFKRRKGMLAGICSGIGHSLNIPPVFIRVVFLLIPHGIIAYGLFYILLRWNEE